MRSYKVMPRAQVPQFLRPVVPEGILRNTVENTRGVNIRSLVFICESSLELNDCT